MTPITALILTFDEEANLPACLDSLSEWTQAIKVVDSGSTDRTREICESYGAEVWEHPFESHSQQWRWALSQLPASCEWVLALDADQVISPELRDELQTTFAEGSVALSGVDGLYISRRQ